MEDPNQEKKSRLDLQPHYIEWGLTALGVIVACVLVVSLLLRMYSAIMTPISRFISTFTVVTTPLIMLPSCGSRSFCAQFIICAEN